MAFLSTPERFTPPIDNVTEIIKLIEDELATKMEFDKPLPKDVPGYHFRRVTIAGHYPTEDCREVCKQYQSAGWEEVYYHSVPANFVKDKVTTFTFKTPKK